jgi:hypothetical protein
VVFSRRVFLRWCVRPPRSPFPGSHPFTPQVALAHPPASHTQNTHVSLCCKAERQSWQGWEIVTVTGTGTRSITPQNKLMSDGQDDFSIYIGKWISASRFVAYLPTLSVWFVADRAEQGLMTGTFRYCSEHDLTEMITTDFERYQVPPVHKIDMPVLPGSFQEQDTGERPSVYHSPSAARYHVQPVLPGSFQEQEEQDTGELPPVYSHVQPVLPGSVQEQGEQFTGELPPIY